MVLLSIPGLPQAGNLSSPLWTVPGPWPSSGGLRMRCRVRAGMAGRAASTPSCAWSAPCLSHRVPHDVLTLSWLLLRPPLLTHRATSSARGRAVRGRPWPRDLCCREKGGDDERTGIGARTEGKIELPLQDHDST
jgi:hypothetical protein